MTVSVLVVDDSSAVRTLLTRLLQSDSELKVCGTAADGESALMMVQSQKPDVVALDLNMPGLNGFEVTRKIMEVAPLPIIIVTTDEKSTANPFALLEAGAVAVLQKPGPPGHAQHKEHVAHLIQTIKALKGSDPRAIARTVRTPETITPGVGGDKVSCIAIGASTGGPQILKKIIESLPADYPIPILITQHIAKGFSTSFVKWLNVDSKLKVILAEEGMPLQAGKIFIAPDDVHMGLSKDQKLVLSDSAREYGMRPSIAYLFRSLERTVGKNCVAVLLTGMGKDGATEMAALRNRGALTIAQDRASSLIHGMAGEAIACGAACEVLDPDAIIQRLLGFAAARKAPNAASVPRAR
jgi:two-component system chemotaxis response regulator CheB